MRIQPEEKEDKIILNVSRESLESLVEKVKLSKRKTRTFYEADIDALKLLEINNDFLLFGLEKFEEDKNTMVFVGRKYLYEARDRVLKGKNVELVIHGLNEHETCARFAYAAYQLTLTRLKTYPVIQKIPRTASDLLGNFNNDLLKKAEKYFNERLGEYFKKWETMRI